MTISLSPAAEPTSFAAHVHALPTINRHHPGFAALARGTAVLPDDESVGHYFAAYGSRHVGRVTPLLDAVLAGTDICRRPFQTVDWGCGALLATYLLRDRLADAGLAHHHRRAVGTDASVASLQRARAWWDTFGIADSGVVLHPGLAEHVVAEVLASLRPGLPTLHLAANFLDLAALPQVALGRAIGAAMGPRDVFAAVSPVYGDRLDEFRRAAGLTVTHATPDYSRLPGRNTTTASFIAQTAAPVHN